MPYIEVDIDVDDFYSELSMYEKQSLAEMLENDGYCTLNEDDRDEDEFVIENPTLLDEMWVESMKKLFHSRMQLSLEDEETIKNIASKL